MNTGEIHPIFSSSGKCPQSMHKLKMVDKMLLIVHLTFFKTFVDILETPHPSTFKCVITDSIFSRDEGLHHKLQKTKLVEWCGVFPKLVVEMLIL